MKDSQASADELSQIFAARSHAILEQARPPLERLQAIAKALRILQSAEAFQQSLDGLARQSFTLIVFGRFKNGKSTLLNILLGVCPAPYGAAPLPMDEMPATARLTTITYADEPVVTVVRTDGSEEERSLDWFRTEAKLRPGEIENRDTFADIAEFRLSYPFAAGRAGIRLIDSPGTDEAPERTAIALRAINEADAAIMVFRSDQLMDQDEMGFLRTMTRLGLNSFFTVINRIDGVPVDRRFRAYAWERRVTEFEGGTSYENQDLRDKNIYFVDARSALMGRLGGDEAAVEASGMSEFERRLHAFYEAERRQVHVHRWIDLADLEAARIEDYIDSVAPALAFDAEEFKQHYDAIQPRIAELAARRIRLHKYFRTFEQRASAALLVGYQDLISDIVDDLQGSLKRGSPKLGQKQSVIANAALPSTTSWGSRIWTGLSPGQQRKAVEEALTAANGYVAARTQDWGTAAPPEMGASRIIEPLFEELLLDLEDEVREVEQAFHDLAFKLAGEPIVAPESNADAGRWWDRILPTAAGFLVSGVDGAVMGATNKWKGFGKGLAVNLGVLGTIVVMTGGLALPAAVAGWIISVIMRAAWRGSDLETEVKEKVVELLTRGEPNQSEAGGRFGGLRDEARKAGPSLAASVERMIAPFRERTINAYDAEIVRHSAMFDEMLRHSAFAAEEKLALAEEFARLRREIGTHRFALAEVRTMTGKIAVDADA